LPATGLLVELEVEVEVEASLQLAQKRAVKLICLFLSDV